MTLSILLVFFNLFVVAFNAILIVRIVTSWIMADMQANWFGRLLIDTTEPVLAPVRGILPQTGLIDLAPTVTIIGLYAVRALLFGLLFH